MDIRKIIEDYLVAGGYDGLYCGECACGIEDLWPCAEIGNVEDCSPGYKHSGCSPECGQGCGFHVGPNMPQENMEGNQGP